MTLRVASVALAALFSTWASAPLAAQAQPQPSPSQAAPAPAAPAARIAARPALWMVKDADTTIYLFGTIHLLPDNIDWKAGPVERAYAASKEVVLEIHEPDPAAMQQVMITKGLDRDRPLSQKLSPAEKARYEAALARLGLPAAQFEPMRPWLAATVLSVTAVAKQGWDPNSGVERKVIAAAKQDGKPVTGVETIEQQIDYLAGMPEELQIRFLMSAVDDLDQVSAQSREMLDAWVKGEPERLAAVINKGTEKTPELRARLLSERNARWASWIEQRLKQPGAVFMAVGAGHLAGRDSVQDYLAKKRITAVRVAR